MSAVKNALARSFEVCRLNDALLALQRATGPGFARAVNYHGVVRRLAGAFEEQLRFFRDHFEPVGYEQLLALHTGRWRSEKPALVLTFDDGINSHAEIVAPLLDRYGFTGWFFIPAGLIREEDAEQSSGEDDPPLSWRQVRTLSERHVIGCHTMMHTRLKSELTREQLDVEIRQAKELLEKRLGKAVQAFCWVGGEERSYSSEAARVIRETGYEVSFMTNNSLIRPHCDLLQLQRTNIEASFPLHVVKFQLSGFLDLMYLPKRRRVNRLTRSQRSA